MKELEAKLEISKRIDKRQNIFCPMINGMCKTKCESFVEPEIYNINNNDVNSYNVQGGYCSASCLHSIGD